MKSMKHTPGPWTAKFGPGAGGGYQGVDGPNGERIALCDEDTRMGVFTREANARLVAAAPDLLAALLHIVNDTPTPGGDAVLTVKGYNMACAAIARAEGRGA